MAMEAWRKKVKDNPELYDKELMEGERDRRFGDVEGVEVGDTFETRAACAAKGVHRTVVAGISGSAADGAYSICVSSAYEDDEDGGDTLTYTGTGGKDSTDNFSGDGPQIDHQTFEHQDNAALKRSCETGKEVRVIRGPNPNSKYATTSGYRYDGLYVVTKAYRAPGKSGFQVCRYELQRKPDQRAIPINPDWNGA